MHIPDGILQPAVLAGTGGISFFILTKSVKHAKEQLEQSAVPIMGVMAAFIFAAQMVNFPLLGAAASGHLIGATLAALIFGFWPSTIIMTTVVSIQALLFQDGGITALGANVLNMAIIAPAVAAVSFHLLHKIERLPSSFTIFIAAWLSVIATSLSAAVQLGLSDVVSYTLALKSLLLWHSLIGIGEGLITIAVMPYVKHTTYKLNRKAVTR